MSTDPSRSSLGAPDLLQLVVKPSGPTFDRTRVARLLARMIFHRLRVDADDEGCTNAADEGGSVP